MSDAVRRGVRTVGQLLVTAATSGALFAALPYVGVDVSAEGYAAVTAVLLPFVVVLLNALEDAGTIPAVLKAPASGGADPVPDDVDEVPTEDQAARAADIVARRIVALQLQGKAIEADLLAIRADKPDRKGRYEA